LYTIGIQCELDEVRPLLIDSLEIDDHILEKLESKHGVTFDEAEEACLSDN